MASLHHLSPQRIIGDTLRVHVAGSAQAAASLNREPPAMNRVGPPDGAPGPTVVVVDLPRGSYMPLGAQVPVSVEPLTSRGCKD